MADSERENKSVAFLRRCQNWLITNSSSIVYLLGSYLFWLFSAPLMYEAVASCNGIERLGYLFFFLFSPITVPLFFLIGIFTTVFMDDSIIELLLFLMFAAMSYTFVYILVRVSAALLGARIKRAIDSAGRKR